jgi:hypothetical protein
MSEQQGSGLEVKVYIEQTAKLLDLPIPQECEQGVMDNFVRMQAIAALVTEFPLPDDIETAPVFQP